MGAQDPLPGKENAPLLAALDFLLKQGVAPLVRCPVQGVSESGILAVPEADLGAEAARRGLQDPASAPSRLALEPGGIAAGVAFRVGKGGGECRERDIYCDRDEGRWAG